MKRLLVFGFFIFLVLLVSGCQSATETNQNLEDFIPKNTQVVLKIENADDAKAALAANDIFFPILSKPVLSSLLKGLHLDTPSLLCISGTETNKDYTVITRNHPALIVSDTIKSKANIEVTETVLLANQSFYTLKKDSVVVISSSREIIKQLSKKKTPLPVSFQKAYKVANTNGISAIFKATSFPINDSLGFSTADWGCLNTVISSDRFQATGVIIPNDSSKQLSTIFKGLLPQKHAFAAVVPTGIEEVVSFTYDDYNVFKDNLKSFGNTNIEEPSDLFNLVNEVTTVTLLNQKALVIKSLDITLTKENLQSYLTQKSVFKDVAIYTLSNSDLFRKAFYPLVKTEDFSIAFQLSDFFIFVPNEELATHFISNFLNKSTLSEDSLYQNISGELSSSSSIFILQSGERFINSVSGVLGISSGSKSVYKRFPLGAVQLIYDRNFAHINVVCKEATSVGDKRSKTVSELASVVLKNKLASPPVFFTNHTTKEPEVVVQDDSNVLYLISKSGKILWQKQLNGKILGTVHEIDILKNGKKQLAFTTPKALYVIDRNGKPVRGFPKTFSDVITQPLSVFDYDATRNYRFVIVRGKSVALFDNKGKRVKGFTFSKTKTPIIQAPVHIRIGSKDYILIAEENGILHILNRVGKKRVNVSKKFDFSAIPIVKEGTNFVVIENDNTKNSMDTKGNVLVRKLKVSGAYYFTVKGRVKATLDDNLLRINGKLIDLPYGIYTRPILFSYRNKTYITLTDTQEKKVYLFDKYGALVNGFPVYGIAEANVRGTKRTAYLVVQTDATAFTVYRIN